MAEQQQAEQATEATQSDDSSQSWEDLIAEASEAEESTEDEEADDEEESDESEGEEAEAGSTEKPKPKVLTEKKKWGDLEKPTPKAIAVRERLAQRAGQQQAAQTAQQLQAQLEAERQRLAQVTRQQQEADARFKELLDRGEVDEALKVKGVSATVGDLSRKLLQAKGGLPAGGKDPRVDQLEAQLKQYIGAEQKRAQEQQTAAHQAQLRAQEEQDIKDLTEEIASLPYEGSDALAKAPGFASHVYQAIRAGGDEPVEVITANIRGTYQQLLNDLYAVAMEGGLELPTTTEQKPGKTGAKPRAVVPRSGAKSPRGTVPESLQHHGQDRWKAILAGKL